jgi:hypothetical protein
MVMLSKTRCHTGVVLALLWLSSYQTSGLAQSPWSMSAVDLANPVRQYVPNDAVPTAMSIPSNLVTSDIYRPLLERMLRGSRTFRRQCVRLASEPRWLVHIQIRSSAPRYGVRALTTIERHGDDLTIAIVEIFESRNDFELIAHELEHVLERIDGVDLRSLATVSGSGVRAIDADISLFETQRAKRVGAIVRQEMHASTG